MTETRMIALSAIDDGGRLRALDPDWVALLAEEIGRDGLKEPVRIAARGDGFKLIDGARRLAAARSLGLAGIEARIETAEALADDAAVRLAEIKSAMLRGELTVLDRALHLCAWRDIYLSVHTVSKGGRKPARAPSPDSEIQEDEELSASFALSFSEAAQRVLQISRRSLFLALKIATIPAGLARRIALHACADRQGELLLLAEQDADRQAAIVDMLTSDPAEAADVGDAIAKLDGVVLETLSAAQKLSARFAALPEKQREAFFAMNAAAIARWYAGWATAKKHAA